MNVKLKSFSLPILWIFVIIFLSVSSTDELSESWFSLDFPHADKLVHFVMYMVLTYLLLRSLAKENLLASRKWLAVIILIPIILGILMEFIQGQYLVERNFELLDIIANISGTLIACIFYKIFNKKRKDV